MTPYQKFKTECAEEIVQQANNSELIELSKAWMAKANTAKYSYHFDWLGRPIIQYPQDVLAMQEIIWAVKPDLIIETGIAHGGSLIMSASMLALLDYTNAIATGTSFDPKSSTRRVLGLDIDIRAHNKEAIESHPMAHLIKMIQGSSISAEVIEQVHHFAKGYKKILIFLDSNHTHDHVLAELEAYAPLTSQNSYCCVFDTVIEDLPGDMFLDRPWDKGNNPKTAVWKYLELLEKEGRTASDGSQLNLKIDRLIENKLLISVAPDGYLKRI